MNAATSGIQSRVLGLDLVGAQPVFGRAHDPLISAFF